MDIEGGEDMACRKEYGPQRDPSKPGQANAPLLGGRTNRFFCNL